MWPWGQKGRPPLDEKHYVWIGSALTSTAKLSCPIMQRLCKRFGGKKLGSFVTWVGGPRDQVLSKENEHDRTDMPNGRMDLDIVRSSRNPSKASPNSTTSNRRVSVSHYGSCVVNEDNIFLPYVFVLPR